MEEPGVDVGDHVAGVTDDQSSVTGEHPDVGDGHAHPVAALPERVEVDGWHGDHHAFLGLGQPDLPRLQARILAGDQFEFDVGSDALGHLADGGRQSARATVGDRRVQILGADQRIDEQLLDDGIADLHARAGDFSGGGVHGRRREGGAPDSVPTGRSAEDDDPITRSRPGVQRSRRRRADAAGEHQRVGRVGGVVENGAGDGGQSDLVAVVGDAVDHAVSDPAGMERAGREVVEWQVCGPETQHVGHRDRPVGDAQDIADHAADAGVRAAEGLDRGGMVVRLGLEGDGRALGELDDAGVAHEGRTDEGSIEILGAAAELREQRFDRALVRPALVDLDGRSERLVGAVLAPGLGEYLDLDIGDVPSQALVLVADGAQLLDVEVQRAVLVEFRQTVVVEPSNRDDVDDGCGDGGVDHRRFDGPGGPSLDDGVRDEPADDVVGHLGRDPTVELDAPAHGGAGHVQAEHPRGVQDGVGGGVGDAGEQRDLDAVGRGKLPAAVLEQRIDQDVVQAGQIIGVQTSFDEHDVGDVDRPLQLDAEVIDGVGEDVDSGVPVERANRQTVPGRHPLDPTDRACPRAGDCTKILPAGSAPV